MTAFADHGAAGNGEPLAIMLRPGSAGSNTAADHIETTRLAMAQLPLADLELRHRRRARCEDRIRNAKDTELRTCR